MTSEWPPEQQINWKQAYASLIEFGRATLTSSALLNGGAAAAIIAAATGDTTIILSRLFWALLSFCIGAASALLALGLAYFAEFCLLQQHRGLKNPAPFDMLEIPVRWWAMGAGLLSILLFVVGIFVAFSKLA